MRLTMNDALNGQHFHLDMDGCTLPGAVTYGKSGRAQPRAKLYDYRRNGRTRLWKREPERFEIPVKYGLRGYGYITSNDHAHLAERCPAVREIEEYWARKHGDV